MAHEFGQVLQKTHLWASLCFSMCSRTLRCRCRLAHLEYAVVGPFLAGVCLYIGLVLCPLVEGQNLTLPISCLSPYDLSNCFHSQCLAWSSLPLSTIGRVNLLKMVYLPKFLYFFRQTPVPMSKSFFNRLDGVMSLFLLAGRTVTLSPSTLCLPVNRGYLALPKFLWYNWKHYWLRRDGGFLILKKSGWS